MVLAVCEKGWLLGALGRSIVFSQLSSRPENLICTDLKWSPSSTVHDSQKIETTQMSIIVLLENECEMEYYLEYYCAAIWVNIESTMLSKDGATMKDHILHESIYTRCSEEANLYSDTKRKLVSARGSGRQKMSTSRSRLSTWNKEVLELDDSDEGTT